MCGEETEGFSGLPFDSTGTLDGIDDGRPNAPYLPRGLLNPACRQGATALFQHAPSAMQIEMPNANANIIIVVMSPSSSRTTLLRRLSPDLRRPSTKGAGLSRRKDLPTSAGDAVRSRGAPQTGKSNRPPDFFDHHGAPSHLTCYRCRSLSSRLRTQRKPVPWVCSANPPRPRADVVMSATGLCQDPPRIDRTTPFLSGPCGFRSGACL